MKRTFFEWLHILKFNDEHHAISDGTNHRRFDPMELKNPIVISIENKFYDYLKVTHREYMYLLREVWTFQEFKFSEN